MNCVFIHEMYLYLNLNKRIYFLMTIESVKEYYLHITWTLQYNTCKVLSKY